MDCTFPLFPQFPLEIRQQIWRTALSHYWSFTKLRRAGGGRVKLVGEVRRNVAHSCREARAAVETTCKETKTLGWVDLGRHVFFFRDAKFDRGLMTATEHGGDDEDILSLVQHMVVNPRDWSHLWGTIDVIKRRCASLRTLVVVAPWFDPADMPASHDPLSFAPYEDWGQVFDKTPSETDLSSLRDAIERGAAANSARNDEYRAKLDEAAAQVTDDNVAAFEHVFGRTRLALQKLEQAVQEFPGTKPRLYLRTREELLSPPTVQ